MKFEVGKKYKSIDGRIAEVISRKNNFITILVAGEKRRRKVSVNYTGYEKVTLDTFKYRTPGGSRMRISKNLLFAEEI